MNYSESIANLSKALSIVQGQLTHAVKDSKNPFFKSNYADLGSVWDSCRSLLAENGLSVMQFPGEYIDGNMSLTTILAHSSGEFIEQEMSLPVSKPDAQGAGSALTYMRRYALAAVIGIYQADDDGNEAAKQKPVERITPDQLIVVQDLIDEVDVDIHKILGHYKKLSLEHLTVTEATTLISQLEKKRNG